MPKKWVYLWNQIWASANVSPHSLYRQTWEKVDIVENPNGTISFNQKRVYIFNEEMSTGSEDDVVIVPNIPMLSATSQSKHAARYIDIKMPKMFDDWSTLSFFHRFLRLAMASIMDILKIKPFVEVSVGQLLWGYEDPLLKLAKDVVPKEQKLPYEEFGLMYGKNSTSQVYMQWKSSNENQFLNKNRYFSCRIV